MIFELVCTVGRSDTKYTWILRSICKRIHHVMDEGVGISHSTRPYPVSAMGGCQASPPNPPHAPRHRNATTFPTISPTPCSVRIKKEK
jgi:hypothetical protein